MHSQSKASEGRGRPVAVVTGAGSGIGLATALGLASEGFDLALVGRRIGPLQECAATIASAFPDAAAVVRASDVGDPDAAAPLIGEVSARFGRLDALINNAGHAPLLPIADTTPGVLRDAFAINAIGPGALIAAAWPRFVENGRGVIVNVSTMGTLDPFPGFFAYAAAKASVNLFARSIAKEGAAHNIRGFAVAPGAVETPMLRGLFGTDILPIEKCLRAEDVARVIVECVLGKRDAENGATIFLPSPG
ncbi:MAG: SDR family oxidoreductase [Phycisphaeraceae bacterium]|nr:SDR family oxidoreductase [Phycisphaeraceae bacterium]